MDPWFNAFFRECTPFMGIPDPKYSAADVIHQVNLFAELGDWDNAKKIQALKTRVKNAAKYFCEQDTDMKEAIDKKDWAAVSKLLIAHFDIRQKQSSLENQWQQMKQSDQESIETFGARIAKIGNLVISTQTFQDESVKTFMHEKTNYTNAEILKRGLRPSQLKVFLNIQSPEKETFQAALGRALELERTLTDDLSEDFEELNVAAITTGPSFPQKTGPKKV
jgi:hypothetical protein